MGQRFLSPVLGVTDLRNDGLLMPREDSRNLGILLVSAALLLFLGLVMLLSTSYYRGQLVFQDPYYFFRNQLIFAGFGVFAGFLARLVPVAFVKKLSPWAMFGSLILLVLVFIPGLGMNILGGRRWLQIFGMTLQPSEFVKISLVIYLAYLLSKKQDAIDDMVNTMLPPVLVIIASTTLVIAQNDYSTGIFVLVIGLSMLFIGGIKIRHLLGVILVSVPLGLMLLFSKESRVERLLTFIAPDRDPAGTGYQVLASKAALMNGGLAGSGVGLGTRKLGGLPEAQSDFIFAVLGEELGFVGVLGVLLLFGLFAWGGFKLAIARGRTFEGLAIYGLTMTIVFQALLNIAVVCGLLPPTGVTLPFFSAGGTSLIIVLASIGLIVGLALRSQSLKDGAVGALRAGSPKTGTIVPFPGKSGRGGDLV